MPLAFFCKNSDGVVIHIHEQDEPLKELRDETMNCCVLSGEAASCEELQLDSMRQRLGELSEQGIIDSNTADKIYESFFKREMNYRAEKTRIE